MLIIISALRNLQLATTYMPWPASRAHDGQIFDVDLSSDATVHIDTALNVGQMELRHVDRSSTFRTWLNRTKVRVMDRYSLPRHNLLPTKVCTKLRAKALYSVTAFYFHIRDVFREMNSLPLSSNFEHSSSKDSVARKALIVVTIHRFHDLLRLPLTRMVIALSRAVLRIAVSAHAAQRTVPARLTGVRQAIGVSPSTALTATLAAIKREARKRTVYRLETDPSKRQPATPTGKKVRREEAPRQ
ncbi:hypothetical protein QCE49_24010 [Caballeronia sp. LZ008]|uniref:hypothetical protein n=1 Tax=Caballeronia sp. INML5 TaxID=2921750 RepID=UPI002027FE36|nr:hypothetical protein [Caballeronia sp. INML5]MDR5796454.1 hypothetical protein [Caballeronia sp. LZ008]